MDKIFEWLASHLPAWLLITLSALSASTILAAYLIAFRQGREVRFLGLSLGGRSPAPAPAPVAMPVGPNAPQPTAGDSSSPEPQRSGSEARDTRWARNALVSHDRTFGIESLIHEVADLVLADDGVSVISLSGAGGIGKTTVAYEVAKRCSIADSFTKIAWASAKNAVFSSGALGDGVMGTVYWREVVRSIAVQLGVTPGSSPTMWEQELTDRLSSASDSERFLLVLDNLENLEDTEETVDKLNACGFRRPHKLVVATRWALPRRSTMTRDIDVPRLSEDVALKLIRHEGRLDKAIMEMSSRKLARIVDTTEGNPYLIKLVVGLYLESRRPLDVVIDELIDEVGQSNDPNLVGAQVRDHLYMQSIEELERQFGQHTATTLIAGFCARPKGDSVSYSDLKYITGISNDSVFANALQTACRLNLVRASDENRRYSIHSLLYEFARHV